MSAYRLERGGLVDRRNALGFRFDGRELQGFAGRLYVLLQKNGPDGVPSRNENREPEDAEGQLAAGFLST